MCLFFSCPKLHSISFPHHIVVNVLIKLENPQSHMIDRCTFPRIALLAVLSPHPWHDTLTPRQLDTSHTTSEPVSEFRCLSRQQPHVRVRRARIHEESSEESSAGAVLVIAAPLKAPCRSPAAHVARQPTKGTSGIITVSVHALAFAI